MQSPEWEQLWGGPLVSSEEVHSIISFETVRVMKTTCPKNLATLCRRVCLCVSHVPRDLKQAILKLHTATLTAVACPEAQTQGEERRCCCTSSVCLLSSIDRLFCARVGRMASLVPCRPSVSHVAHQQCTSVTARTN
jgi:hypothetical protein